nr:helix-turn-helix domain-containing protein [Streptomyces sp. 3211]
MSGSGWKRSPCSLTDGVSTEIAKELRVSVRSVKGWRRAWREAGQDAVRSRGPASRPKLSDVLLGLDPDPVGRPSQCFSSTMRAPRPTARGWVASRVSPL